MPNGTPFDMRLMSERFVTEDWGSMQATCGAHTAMLGRLLRTYRAFAAQTTA